MRTQNDQQMDLQWDYYHRIKLYYLYCTLVQYRKRQVQYITYQLGRLYLLFSASIAVYTDKSSKVVACPVTLDYYSYKTCLMLRKYA